VAIAKRVLIWLVIAFLIYYLATQPLASAHAVQGAGEAIQRLFRSLQEFFTELIH
jgi:hypothetical protein